MNKNDREYFNFIMSLNEEQFERWMESIDQTQVDYAIKLMHIGRRENFLKEMELMENTGSDKFTQAKAIIDRIRNKSIT